MQNLDSLCQCLGEGRTRFIYILFFLVVAAEDGAGMQTELGEVGPGHFLKHMKWKQGW